MEFNTMSESEKQATEEEKKKSPFAVIFVVLALLVIIIGIAAVNKSKDNKTKDMTTTETTAEKTVNETVKETASSQESSANTESIASSATQEVSADFDVEKAATPKILGNPEAPIKISEHSSFTCGHCATFHKGNFKQIKKDYVDTGKAYIVFDDFPRNQYDLYIGAIARCINDEAYFNFIQLIFETQKDWIESSDYIAHIKQNAKLTGTSEAQINNCLNSTELHEKMATNRDKVMENHKVETTPTLVINDSIVMPGLSAYDKIKEVLDAELAKSTK